MHAAQNMMHLNKAIAAVIIADKCSHCISSNQSILTFSHMDAVYMCICFMYMYMHVYIYIYRVEINKYILININRHEFQIE